MKKQLRFKNLLYFFMKGPRINICDNYVFKSGKEIRLIWLKKKRWIKTCQMKEQTVVAK